MSRKIRLVLADDHLMFTDTLATCFEKERDMKVVAAVTDGQKLIEAVAAKKPHLVLTDISMPGMDGVAAVKILNERFPETKIIVLSFYNDSSFIENMAAIGAHGYVTKGAPLEVLLTAIRTVAAGGTYFEPGEKKPITLSRQGNLLSRREVQILELVSHGKTSVEIGAALSITKDTVESHRKNILRKLELTGKTELLRYALAYIKNYDGNG